MYNPPATVAQRSRHSRGRDAKITPRRRPSHERSHGPVTSGSRGGRRRTSTDPVPAEPANGTTTADTAPENGARTAAHSAAMADHAPQPAAAAIPTAPPLRRRCFHWMRRCVTFVILRRCSSRSAVTSWAVATRPERADHLGATVQEGMQEFRINGAGPEHQACIPFRFGSSADL